MIADGSADANHARLELFAVDRVAVAAHKPQLFDQRIGVGDRVAA